MIFQDSGAMMNPTRKIGDCFVEYIRTHENISKRDAWAKGIKMLERMRLPSGDNIMKSYPFQLSGGMRQRVGIAMGMTYQPRLLLADEPTGNLDSKTSADVLGLLKRTSMEFNQTIVMITHNNEIAQLADRIVRIEDGRIAG